MSDDPAAPDAPAEATAAVRAVLARATQHLLGDTIEVTDEQWRAGSRLPGWTRGHVATHLARNADGLGRLAIGAAGGEREPMYASAEARDAEIEQGAARTGVDLQVDLDTSAGELDAAFDRVEESGGWSERVQMRGGADVPARVLPLMRLGEVILHRIDLDLGFELADTDPATAEWLLSYVAFRIGLRGGDAYPALRLEPDGGAPLTVGSSGEPRTVRGPATALAGWLTQRGGTDALTGADGIEPPTFG